MRNRSRKKGGKRGVGENDSKAKRKLNWEKRERGEMTDRRRKEEGRVNEG